MRPLLAALLFAATLGGCNCGLVILETPVPHLKVKPDTVTLVDVPVAQDTKVVLQITNDSLVADLKQLKSVLDPSGDPHFKLDNAGVDEVFAGQTREVTVTVRPNVTGTIKTKVTFTAADPAVPGEVIVPIEVTAIDAGLPDICASTDGSGFADINFDTIGQNDVARFDQQICNCGTRDLIIDDVGYCAHDGGAGTKLGVGCGTRDPSMGITPIAAGTAIQAGQCITVNLTFNPADLDPHDDQLVINSNDPDESPTTIPVHGQGEACPTACIDFVDGTDGVQPFDQVRIDGSCSTPARGSSNFINGYNWTLQQQPLGSTTTLSTIAQPHTTLPVDLAGSYCVTLDVTDTGGVRSCAPALKCFDVVPNEDLHVQLVWDHPSADLDLHVVAGGGTPFTHETDCYFSNRHPLPSDCDPNASTCAWVDPPDTDQNPSLDHDDNNGYGPENTNIIHPKPGSRWQLLVHYWNKQTDGDPRTNATLRVFCYGQQVLEVSRELDTDQLLWTAVNVDWPQTPGDPCILTQVGQVDPFLRPF